MPFESFPFTLFFKLCFVVTAIVKHISIERVFLFIYNMNEIAPLSFMSLI